MIRGPDNGRHHSPASGLRAPPARVDHRRRHIALKWFQNLIAGDRERAAPLPPQRAKNARRGPRVRAQGPVVASAFRRKDDLFSARAPSGAVRGQEPRLTRVLKPLLAASSSMHRRSRSSTRRSGSAIRRARAGVFAAPGAGNSNLEAGNWKLETGNWKLEAGNWKLAAGTKSAGSSSRSHAA